MGCGDRYTDEEMERFEKAQTKKTKDQEIFALQSEVRFKVAEIHRLLDELSLERSHRERLEKALREILDPKNPNPMETAKEALKAFEQAVGTDKTPESTKG